MPPNTGSIYCPPTELKQIMAVDRRTGKEVSVNRFCEMRTNKYIYYYCEWKFLIHRTEEFPEGAEIYTVPVRFPNNIDITDRENGYIYFSGSLAHLLAFDQAFNTFFSCSKASMDGEMFKYGISCSRGYYYMTGQKCNYNDADPLYLLLLAVKGDEIVGSSLLQIEPTLKIKKITPGAPKHNYPDGACIIFGDPKVDPNGLLKFIDERSGTVDNDRIEMLQEEITGLKQQFAELCNYINYLTSVNSRIVSKLNESEKKYEELGKRFSSYLNNKRGRSNDDNSENTKNPSKKRKLNNKDEGEGNNQ